MKNPHFLGWSPMFHWTDSKIQVHAFYCVLALLPTSLLQRELARKGEHLSINRMLEELGGIRKLWSSTRAVKASGRLPLPLVSPA
jgi:hypothetical protein